MTRRILVAYATKHGHTRRVAECVGTVLHAHGADVDLVDLGDAEVDPHPFSHDGAARHLGKRYPNPHPFAYDGVVVAASVHAGHHEAAVVRWTGSHATTLAMRPTAFLSVSLAAADDTDEARADATRMINELVDITGWEPTIALPVAGALQYREYDVMTRLLMRLIARHHRASTDTSRDVDFTDWQAVEQFAAGFAQQVTAGPARAGQPGTATAPANA
jgi:menaquinone-dependent protoporphyrinogen oxidase